MLLDGLDYFRSNIERDRRLGPPNVQADGRAEPPDHDPQIGAPDRFRGNEILFARLDQRLAALD